MSENTNTGWVFWLVSEERYLGAPYGYLNMMLKKLEEKVAASTVGTFSEMVQLQNISGVLMKEAARQEKGIFWCQSTRSPGGEGGV